MRQEFDDIFEVTQGMAGWGDTNCIVLHQFPHKVDNELLVLMQLKYRPEVAILMCAHKESGESQIAFRLRDGIQTSRPFAVFKAEASTADLREELGRFCAERRIKIVFMRLARRWGSLVIKTKGAFPNVMLGDIIHLRSTLSWYFSGHDIEQALGFIAHENSLGLGQEPWIRPPEEK